jgi:hypothetical protein
VDTCIAPSRDLGVQVLVSFLCGCFSDASVRVLLRNVEFAGSGERLLEAYVVWITGIRLRFALSFIFYPCGALRGRVIELSRWKLDRVVAGFFLL